MAKGYSLAALAENLYKLVYPVGICVDFAKAVNPNELFPGTTWVQITDGRSVRIANQNVEGDVLGQIGALGGSDNVTITANQMPSHVHRHDHTHNMNHTHPRTWVTAGGGHEHRVVGNTGGAGAHGHGIDIYGLNTSKQQAIVGAGGNLGVRYGVQNTQGVGDHAHYFDVTSGGAGHHDHYFDLQWFSGNTSWIGDGSGNLFTEGAGAGEAVNVMNLSRYYARWTRTA